MKAGPQPLTVPATPMRWLGTISTSPIEANISSVKANSSLVNECVSSNNDIPFNTRAGVLGITKICLVDASSISLYLA